ncbi:MAG: tRNA 2-thiocytidine biosynthesis TtcA family protein [candidate division KSB1 bacterium]|nr:tRNA 2-thiocytidine biosynthesis TtcA family protein [candidate division KSB1 bacterium]
MSRSAALSSLHRGLISRVDKAIREYALVEPGDRVLVAVSGGADSLSLVTLLLETRYLARWDLELVPVHVHMGFKPIDHEGLVRMREHLQRLGLELRIYDSQIGPLAHSDFNRANPCFLCARLRRQRLFEIADELGCGKLAFGHHRDDVVQTFFLNLLYSREISTMVPKQDFFGGRFYIIRPLYYVDKWMLQRFAAEQGFPVFESGCPSSGRTERDRLAERIQQLVEGNKQLYDNIFKALHRVKLDYLPRQQPGGFR